MILWIDLVWERYVTNFILVFGKLQYRYGLLNSCMGLIAGVNPSVCWGECRGLTPKELYIFFPKHKNNHYNYLLFRDKTYYHVSL